MRSAGAIWSGPNFAGPGSDDNLRMEKSFPSRKTNSEPVSNLVGGLWAKSPIVGLRPNSQVTCASSRSFKSWDLSGGAMG